MQVVLQNVALPARLRPAVPLTDDELMAFSKANEPCKVERLASGEILVMTPSGFENNLREAYVVHELFALAESDGRGFAFSSNAGFNLPDGPRLAPLLAVAREARTASGRDPSTFVVTVSSDLRPSTLERLEALGVDRVVVFSGAPFAENARRLAGTRP